MEIRSKAKQMATVKNKVLVLRGNGTNMPVQFRNRKNGRRNGITLWYACNGWTEMSKDEAIELANTILGEFGQK